MVMRRPGQNFPVTGPRGQSVVIKFFDDGAVRFRLNHGGPMMIRHAFLPGSGQNVIVELTPMSGSPWAQTQGA